MHAEGGEGVAMRIKEHRSFIVATQPTRDMLKSKLFKIQLPL